MDLPDEILLMIFSFLNPEERSVICMSVCRRWRAIAQDRSLWYTLAFPDCFSCKQIKAFLRLPYVQTAVSSLKLDWIPDVPLPNLLELCMSKLLVHSMGKLKDFSSLRLLRIGLCSLDYKIVSYRKSAETRPKDFSELVSELHSSMPLLRIEVAKLSGGESNISRNLTHLGSLQANWTVKELSLHAVANSSMTDIKQLFPQNVSGAAPQINSFTGFGKNLDTRILPMFSSALTKIELRYLTKDQAFQLMPEMCPNLEVCKLFQISDGPMPNISLLPHLVTLSLGNSLTDENCFNILSVWSNLKRLSLYCRPVTKHQLQLISKKNPNLTSLHLGVSMVRYPPVPQFSGGQEKVTFSKLRELTLNYITLCVLPLVFAPVCTVLTAEPLVGKTPDVAPCSLVLSCPSLRKVRLPGSYLTAGSLEPLQDTLRDISVLHKKFNCKTASHFKAIGVTCPKINNLQMEIDTDSVLAAMTELQSDRLPKVSGDMTDNESGRGSWTEVALIEMLKMFGELEMLTIKFLPVRVFTSASKSSAVDFIHGLLKEHFNLVKPCSGNPGNELVIVFFPFALRKTLGELLHVS